MSDSTNYSSVASSLQKTNELIKDIQERFDWEDRPDQAYAALRVVLQTLRDRLPVNEAADFAAQMPLLIRGIFYEGWRPAAVPKKMNSEEFLNHIRQNFRFEVDVEDLVYGVMESVEAFVTEGELRDIKDNLPEDIADLLP